MEETSEADGGDGWPEGRTQMYSAPAHSEECRGLRGGLIYPFGQTPLSP